MCSIGVAAHYVIADSTGFYMEAIPDRNAVCYV